MHRIDARRHFGVAARHTVLFLLCGWVGYRFESPWIWVPAAVLQGFNILGFTILLHEQVHELIFKRRRPRWNRALGLLYALPSAISATQFKIWHLDHHSELGSDTDDPKRAHLSPKKNSRLVKALYFTPALFVLYAIAAAKEARGYPAAARRTIALERLGNLLIHGAVVYLLAAGLTLGAIDIEGGGFPAVLRAYLIPVFVCFPPAFVLNRLGQHYDIDRSNPAAWSTLVNGNRLWRFIFLWSNHHLEHHYYPGVPFYHLTKLNRELQPFFEDNGIPNRTYTQLMSGWLIHNQVPHTRWDWV